MKKFLSAVTTITAVALLSGYAQAATDTWNGGTLGNLTDWSTAGNWNAGAGPVPVAGDVAEFNSTFANQPTLSTSTANVGLETASGLGQAVTITVGGNTLNLAGNTTINGNANTAILLDSSDASNNNLTITGGTVAIQPNNTSFLVNNAGTLAVQSNLSINNGNTLTLGGTNASGNIILSGGASGTTGAVIVNTAGTVTISGNNQYTGGTTLTAGTLVATSNGGALGNGALSLGGGVLDLTNASGTNINFNRPTTVTGNTQITSDLSSGTVGNTYTLGTLSIGAQTLTVAGGTTANETGTAGITFGNVTLSATGTTFTVNNPTGVGSTATSLLTLGSVTGTATSFTVNGTGNTSITGVIGTTSGAVTMSGTGTLFLGGNNTFAGGLNLNSGTIVATNAGGIGPSTNTLKFAGGTLDLRGGGTSYNAAVNLNSTAETIFVEPAAVGGVGVVNAINGGATLGTQTTTVSPGSQTTTNTNYGLTFTGPTSFATSGNNATFIVNGNGVGNGALNLTGGFNTGGNTETLTFNAGSGTGFNTATVAGAFTGTAGTLVLTGNLPFVTVGSSSTGLTGTANNVTLNSTTGSTIYNFNGSNSYTGTTTVTSGTLLATNSGAFGGNGAVSVGLGTGFDYEATGSNQLALGSTLAITSGTGTTIGSSVGSNSTNAEIKVTGNATTTSGAVKVNVYGVSGVTPATGSSTYTLVTGGGSSTLNNATYSLGTVYNNSNFGVGPLSATATALSAVISNEAPVTSAYWTGGLSGATNVWSASNGSTASNFAGSIGGPSQGITPGAYTSVFISDTGNIVTPPTSTVLGANMSINNLTIQDTVNSLKLNNDSFALTIAPNSAATGITMNSGAQAASINANVILAPSGNTSPYYTQTWANNSANPLTINGIVSGFGSLITSGTGTIVLAGPNTYSGTTTVSGGTLVAQSSNSALGSGALFLNGGTLYLTNGSGGTGTGGNMTVKGNNQLTTVTANSTITSDVLAAGFGNTYSFNGGLTIGGQTLTVNGGPNVNGGTAGVTFTTGTILGNPNFVVNNPAGGGTTTLTIGTLSTAGPVSINLSTTGTGGTVSLNGNTAGVASGTTVTIGAGVTVTPNNGGSSLGLGVTNLVNNGTYTMQGANTYSFLTLTGNGVFNNNGANDLVVVNNTGPDTFAGSFANGNGTTLLAMNGTGTLTLSGASTSTGSTTVNSGTLNLTGSMGANGGNGITINSTAVFTESSSGVINGSSVGLTDNSTSTVILAGNNTYGNTTTINNGGTINLGNGGTSGTIGAGGVGGNLTLGGGTLNYTRTDSATQSFNNTTTLTTNTGGNTVNAAAGDTVKLSNISRNAGTTINFGSTGTVTTTRGNSNNILGGWATIGGTNFAVANGGSSAITALTAYDATLSATGDTVTTHNDQETGSVTLNAAVNPSIYTLTINDPTSNDTLALGANTFLFNNGGGLLYSGGSNFNITGTGVIGAGNNEFVVNVSSGGTLTISAPVVSTAAGAGSLTLGGAGTLVLNNTTNSYTGATIVGGGTLSLTGSGTILNGSSITTGGTGVVNESATAKIGGSGTTTFTQGSNGTSTLAGANTYTGATTVTNGQLNITGSVAGTTTVSNGTLQFSNVNNFGGAVTVSGTGTLLYGASNATDITGVTGGLKVNTTAVSNGTSLPVISIAGNSPTWGSLITATGTALNLELTGTAGQTLTLTQAGNLFSAGINTLTLDSITVNANLTGVLNAGTGNVTNALVLQNGAILKLGSNNVLPSTTNNPIAINSSSTLNLNGTNQNLAGINGDSTGIITNNVSGTSTLTFTGNATSSFLGSIQNGASGTGLVALTLGASSSSQNLTLGGTNTYTGATTIGNNSNLYLTGSMTGSNINVTSGSVQELASGVIGGTGTTFTQNSNSISSLAGANTYTGATILLNNTGYLNVTSLANIGSASSIGKGNNASTATNQASLVFAGDTASTKAVLNYVGTTSASTDRLFTIGVSGGTNNQATILSDSLTAGASLSFTNTGAIAFGNNAAIPFSNNGHLLALGGISTGVNLFAPLITDYALPTLLQINGQTTWALSNANTFVGGTSINNGATLQLNNALALQNSLVTDNSTSLSALSFGGTGTYTIAGLAGTGFIAPGSGVVLNIGTYLNATTQTFNGVVTGAGGLSYFGIAPEILSSNNSYTGGTTLNATNINGNGTLGSLSATESGPAGSTPFGTGFITINAGNLNIAPVGVSTTMISDTGASAAPGTLFTYGGGAFLTINKGTNTGGLTFTVGGGGAVNPFVRTNKGVLIIAAGTNTGDLGIGAGGENVKVAAGNTAPTSTGPAGSVNASIVGLGTTSGASGQGDFLKYDPTNGFQSDAAAYTTRNGTINAATTSSTEISNVVTSDATFAGNNTTGALLLQSGRNLTINPGVTLTVGDNTATHQAGLILNGNAQIVGTAGTSAGPTGTLNFGADEGIIYSFNGTNYIGAVIAGSGGITLAGNTSNPGQGIQLQANDTGNGVHVNTFTGGITINTGANLTFVDSGNGGNLEIQDGSLSDTSNVVTLNGGIITANNGAAGLGRLLTVSPLGGTLAGTENYAFNISGSGLLTLGGNSSLRNATTANSAGDAFLYLSGNNTGLTGGLNVWSSITTVAADKALGSSTNPILMDGGGLSIAGTTLTGFGLHPVTFEPGQQFIIGVQDPTNIFTVSQPVSTVNQGILKFGLGTLDLTAASNYTGSTQMYGGTLLVDESAGGSLYAGNAGIATAGSGIFFDGGTLYIKGSSSGTTTQNLGNLTMGVNNANVSTTGGGTLIADNNGGTLLLNMGTIAMSSTAGNGFGTGSQAGNSLGIVAKGSGTSTITTSSGPDGTSGGGIYGGRVVYVVENSAGVVTSADWATSSQAVSPFTLSAYNGYGLLNPDIGFSNVTHNDSQTGTKTFLAAHPTAINSLKLIGSGTLNLNGNPLTLASGGLLFADSGNYSITDTSGGKTATLVSSSIANTQSSGGTNPGSDFIIQQYGTGKLTISVPIVNYFNNVVTGSPGGGAFSYVATTMTKAGPGTVVLGPMGYTGRTFVNGGVVSIAAESGVAGNNGALTRVTSSTASTTVTSAATSLPFGFGPGSTFLGQTVNSIYGSAGAWVIILSNNANTNLNNGTAAYVTEQYLAMNGGTLQATSNIYLGQSNNSGSAGSVTGGHTVVIGGGGATFDVTNGSTLWVGAQSNIINGIDQDGGVTITSSTGTQGTVVLDHQGNNGGSDFSGPLTINNATLRIGNSSGNQYTTGSDDGNFGSRAILTYTTLQGTADIELGGWTNGYVAGLQSTSAASVLENGFKANANVVFGVINGDDETFAGTIENTSSTGTGTLALVKAGAGSWTLSGNNTYTGNLTIEDGSVIAGSTHAFGTASEVDLFNSANALLNLNGNSNTIGSLASSNGTIGGNLTSSAGGVNLGTGSAKLTVGSDNTGALFAGVIAGTGSVAKIGTGTQTLTSAQTYSGGTTTLNNGGLTSTLATSGAPLGSGGVTINTGTLTLAPSGSGTIADTGATAAGAKLTYGGGSTLNLSLLNGTASSLSYTVGNGTSPALNRVNNGDLVIQFDAAVTNPNTASAAYPTSPTAPTNLGVSESVLVAGGAGNAPAVTHGIVAPTIVGSIGGQSTNLTNSTVSNVTSSGNTLTVNQQFLPTNLVVGDTMLGQVITSIIPSNTLGNWTITLANNPAVGVTNATVGYVVPNANLTISGVTSTSGGTSVTVAAGNALPSSFAVGATLLGNTVTAISGSQAAGWTITLATGGANIANTNAAVTYSTQSLGTFLTYSGANGFVPTSSYTTVAGPITSPLPADEIANVNAAATFSGSPNQVYALAVQKGVTATITGVPLTVGDNNAGQAGVILNGGTIAGTGSLNFGTDEGVIYGFTSANAINTAITGTGGVTFGGSQSITLGGTNTYTGVTTINGNTVSVSSLANGLSNSNLGASSNAASNLVFNGGTLAYTGAAVATDRLFTIGSGGATINQSGTGALSFTNTGTIAVSGAYGNQSLTLTGTSSGGNSGNLYSVLADQSVGNSTSLIKSGSGTWVIEGANTYTGGTTITAGTLQVGGGVAGGIGNLGQSGFGYSGAGGVVVNGGSTLTYYLAANTTESNTITGSGSMNVNGSGALQLTGMNTLSGTTTINNVGSLQLGNANALYNSQITDNVVTNGLTFTSAVGGGQIGLSAANNGGVSTLGVYNILALNGAGNILLQDTGGNAAILDFGGPIGNTNGAATATYSGNFSGTGGLIVSQFAGGGKTQTLSGITSSYTGVTELDALTTSTLAVASLANIGSVSSIGTGDSTSDATNAASLVFGGGTLQYNGTGGSTDRLFTIGDNYGGTAMITSAGTGTISFVGAGPIAFGSTDNAVGYQIQGNRTLTLNGSTFGAANVFTPVIGDYKSATTTQPTNVIVGANLLSGTTSSATWALAGLNTYTGTTTIDAGILNAATLANGGSASSIGASANSFGNLVLGSSVNNFNSGGRGTLQLPTLQYTGTGAQTTDRLFTIGDSKSSKNNEAVGVIDASGATNASTVTFSNTGAIWYANPNGSDLTGTWYTLDLTGSNTGTSNTAANTFAPLIGNTVVAQGLTASAASGSVITVSNAALLAVGQTVTAAGIPSGTTILSISGNSVTLSASITAPLYTTPITANLLAATGVSATGTSGVNTITVSTPADLAVGQQISGTGIASGAVIVNITGSLVTLSANNSGTVSGNVATNIPIGVYVTAAASSGATSLTVNNTTGMVVGQVIQGPGIAPGTTIATIPNGTSLTLSTGTTAALAANSPLTSGLAVNLAKNGVGTWDVTNNNTYTGTTTVNNGTLVGRLATSGTPFGTGNVLINGGTLALAPSASGTVLYNGANAAAGNTFTYAGNATLSLTKNGTSLTYVVGSTAPTANLQVIARTNNGTLIIAPSATDLGSTEVFKVNTTTAGNLPSTGGTNNSALMTNASIVGLGVSSAGNGDFLTYTAANGFASDVSAYTGYAAGGTPTNTQIANVTGSGTLTAGSAAYALLVQSGQTATLGGTLTIGNGTLPGGVILNGGNITGGTLAFGNSEGIIYAFSGASSISSIISGTQTAGTAGVTYAGNQTLTVSGNNTYTGITTINGSTLSVKTLGNGGGASTLGASANTAVGLVINGGTLALDASATVPAATDRLFTIGSGGATIANNNATTANTMYFSNAGNLAITANTDGVQTLTLGGTNTGANIFNPVIVNGATGTSLIAQNQTTLISNGGYWILTGANSYTGGTFINAGSTLQVGNQVLANDPAGSQPAANGAGSLGTGGVVNNGTLVYNSSGLTDRNIISGTGSVVDNGTGTVILDGGNTYSGGTTIAIGANLRLGDGTTTGTAGTGAVTVNGTGVLALDPGTNAPLVLANIVGGTGNVTQMANTTYVTGANTYTGITTLNGGILDLAIWDGGAAASNPNGLGESSNAGTNLVFNGGTLRNTGAAATTDRLFTIGGNATIDSSGSDIVTFNNTGSLVETQNGTLTLTGTNTGSNTFNPIITNTKSVKLVKGGTGTWIVTGANTYNNGTTVQSGILSVGAVDVAGNAQPLGNGTVTLGNTGTGGTGFASNSAVLQYTGGTGTLGLNITAAAGDSSTVSNIGGGTLTLTGTLTKAGLPSAATVLTLANGTFIVSGQITGTDTVFNSDFDVDAATVNLTNANNNYFGPTYIYGAGLLVNGLTGGASLNNALPVTTTLTMGGNAVGTDNSSNTYDLNGSSGAGFTQTLTGLYDVGTGTQQVINSNGAGGPNTANASLNLAIAAGKIDTFGGLLGGTGTANNFSLTTSGAGTVVLTGANSYNLGTTIKAGSTLQVGNGGTSGNLGTGGVANGGSLVYNRSDTLTDNNIITDDVPGTHGSVTQAGTGTTILTAANSYSGGTKVLKGTLYANGGTVGASNSNLGTGPVTVAANAALGGSGVYLPTIPGAGIALAANASLISGGIQQPYVVTTAGTGNPANVGMTLDNRVAGGTILDASIPMANLTFFLGDGSTPGAGTGTYNTPNTNSTYMTVLGSTPGEIKFAAGDVITLNDLTGSPTTTTLQLHLGVPYLLIQAQSNPALHQLSDNNLYAGLTTSGGTDLSGNILNGYVLTPLTINGTVLTQQDAMYGFDATTLYLNNGMLEVVPEPGTWALMLGGLAVLVFLQRRRHNRSH